MNAPAPAELILKGIPVEEKKEVRESDDMDVDEDKDNRALEEGVIGRKVPIVDRHAGYRNNNMQHYTAAQVRHRN